MQGGSLTPSDLKSLLGVFFNPKYLEALDTNHEISTSRDVGVSHETTTSHDIAHVGQKYEDFLASLPLELIVDILLRLDLTNLVCLKLASKYLFSFIGSQGFVDVHLRRSLESGSSNSLVVFRNIASCHSMKLDELEKDHQANRVHHCLARGNFIVGSCNGLLCIRSNESRVILYNPLMRERYQLPAAPVDVSVPQGRSHHLEFGFGYDSSCSDYNVLQIHVASEFSTMLYSLKNNTWRKVGNLPRYVNELESVSGVYCNNALHWVAKVKDGADVHPGVIAFDLHEKAYRLVPFPSEIWSSSSFYMGSLDGYLCASFFSRAFGVDTFHVHVMKEYGRKDSWTPLFKVSGNLRSLTRMRPIAYSSSGDKILVDINDTHLLWYDLQRKKMDGYVPCSHSEAVICSGSVFSPRIFNFQNN